MLEKISGPRDLDALNDDQLGELCIPAAHKRGGRRGGLGLGPGLGLGLAPDFGSPRSGSGTGQAPA